MMVTCQGFESQSQESYYFKMVERTFKLLVERLVGFLDNQNTSYSAYDYIYAAKWSSKMRKIYKALRLMEVHK